MVFQKGQVHENSRRIEPHLASQNLHLCGFQSPPPKKKQKSWGSRHGLDKFQETLPMFDPIRYMQHIITPSENPETLDLSGWCSNHSKSAIQDFKLAGKPVIPGLGAKAGSTRSTRSTIEMLMDFERRSLKRHACLQSQSTIEAGLWKKHRCCRVLSCG